MDKSVLNAKKPLTQAPFSLLNRRRISRPDRGKVSWVPIPHILVVDDERAICEALSDVYTKAGYKVTTSSSGETALNVLREESIDLLVADIRLEGMDGLELTRRAGETRPDVPVIAITGYADIELAVQFFKAGASDFILKPFSNVNILERTQLVLESASVLIEIRHLRNAFKGICNIGGMLSKTAEMHRVFEFLAMVSPTHLTVLLEGETGTGKELAAHTIHSLSPRREGAFLVINCAGVPESLLESELFGYERGAFTGADQTKAGKIELADRGTLFLDEIESMSLAMQAKLLRVFENQEVQRVGGYQRLKVDIRVIAATNVPLEKLLEKGQMRSDFYYRINVMPIRLIPLRQRKEDIPLLVHDFLQRHPLAISKGIKGVSKRAISLLSQHTWPGNVRELQNVLERAVVFATTPVIEIHDLVDTTFSTSVEMHASIQSQSLRQWLSCQERNYLLHQLTQFRGKLAATASSSGLNTKTLYRKMRRHRLDKKDFGGTGSNPSFPETESQAVKINP